MLVLLWESPIIVNGVNLPWTWRESPMDIGNLAEPRKSVSRGLIV